MSISSPLRLAACGFALLTFGLAAIAQTDEAPSQRMLRSEDLKPLAWRSIGPANMAGRVATIALAPGNPKTYFVGFATGGLWKTTNNGTTFEPVFDDKETSSIGSVAVCDAPTNWRGWRDEKDELDEDADLEELGKAKIIWVGTGEGNGRNSSSWGHGVYRSTDGGATFEHLGLEDSHDIPALAVDSRNPDVCYVAALGHLWGANEMRGVYKTDDGGKTWSKSLYIDENTGACDVVIDPSNPIRFTQLCTCAAEPPIRSQAAGHRVESIAQAMPVRLGQNSQTVCPSKQGASDLIYIAPIRASSTRRLNPMSVGRSAIRSATTRGPAACSEQMMEATRGSARPPLLREPFTFPEFVSTPKTISASICPVGFCMSLTMAARRFAPAPPRLYTSISMRWLLIHKTPTIS